MASPWLPKYRKYKALMMAESAIVLQKYDDSEAKPVVDTLDGDSIVVGTKGYAPDTSLANIGTDMHRILVSSKEVLPEVASDTVGMWLRYSTTAEYEGVSVSLTIHYGNELSSYFDHALIITGDTALQDYSESSVEGAYASMGKNVDGDHKANATKVGRITKGVLGYAGSKLMYYKRAFNEALGDNEDIFGSPTSYSRLEDFKGLKKIIIPEGDLTIDVGDDGVVKPQTVTHIFVEGTATVEGMIDLSNITLVASGSIVLSEGVRGSNVTLYSKERIELNDTTHIQGLVMAEGDVVLNDSAAVINNSVVMTAGTVVEAGQGMGSLYVTEGATAHGMLISTANGRNISEPAGNIFLSQGAQVTGVVFAKGFVENSTDVVGSVVAKSMSCDGQMHCFGNGTIDRLTLGTFYQPIDMKFKGDQSNFVMAQWIKDGEVDAVSIGNTDSDTDEEEYDE